MTFTMKLNAPRIRVSMTVMTMTDLMRAVYCSVFPLILGLTSPRCIMVARFPLNIPPIPPLTVNIGGNNASIQGLELNRGMNTAIKPPARRLTMLKLRASVV